jgi:hypothetical protein
MNNIKQIDHNRRIFFKTAGLLSLSISLPMLVKAEHAKTICGVSDPVIQIHTGNKIAVLISVFSVEPENAQKLIELFEEGTSVLFSKLKNWQRLNLLFAMMSLLYTIYNFQ